MKITLYVAALTVAVCASAGAAQAAPILSSSAYAAAVSLSAAGGVRADVLLGQAAGTVPPVYDDSGDLARIDQKALLVAAGLDNAFVSANQTLTSGVVTTHAYSAASFAKGTTTINDADLSLATTALLMPLGLGLTADTITSTTIAGFTGSGVYANGSSSITGLRVGGTALGALTIDGSLFANADPNTVLLDRLGVLITLNEQGKVQDASSISMFTNAIHVSLDDFLFDGRLISGDIILGHSEASVAGFVPAAAVPEPATWAMMIVGLSMVGATMRGRRRRALPLRA